MTGGKSYSGIAYWNNYFAKSLSKSDTRRTGERIWLNPFLPLLRSQAVQDILDLGCGSGADALELARQGFRTCGLDLALEALRHGRDQAHRERLPLSLAQADVAEPLPFPKACFDAVICNLTLHMFPEELADEIVAEVARILKGGGLFLLHVNATADIPYRTVFQPPVKHLYDNFYCLGEGQTMRFFSERCCRSLLSAWHLRSLDLVEARDDAGDIKKIAWRCVAEKPATA